MTTRPGLATVDVLRKSRSKHLCHAIKITRQDGFVLRITDHDRVFTFEGEQYQPVTMGELSAERREAALRAGDQEARGFVDGSIVTIPDLLGNRYRGAEVRDVILDWANPRHVPVRHRKWIRTVSWTGSGFVGVLHARSQVMQRPAGGRFAGVFTQQCLYKLGEPNTCKADVGIDTIFAGAGARVETILDDRMEFELAAGVGVWPVDDFYRDGEIQWRWAPASVTGTCTATTTTTTLTDNTKSWTTNEHAGREVRILGAPGSFVLSSKWARIVSNTATTVTFATQANMAGHTAGTDYDICGLCANLDVVSPIVYYTQGNRRIQLLLPTPFPIVVNDSGIIRAGCDGLVGTCKEKFDNLINHGGDPFAPSASAIIEPPEAQ